MLVLLPPSESKAERPRGSALDLARLSFPSLTGQREAVASATAAASATPEAPVILGVSPTLTADIARNTRLTSAPTLPALECYVGVLYDALGYAELPTDARRRANRWLVVVSALYGAVRPTDRIAPYRLSMAVNLPGVGPLATAWRPHLEAPLAEAAGRGLIVDTRSSTYAAAWSPEGTLAERWVHVAVPGATHMAKHTRGLVARALCVAGIDPRRPEGLVEPLRAALGADFVVELAEPTRSGKPWTLSVTPPPGPAAGIRIAAG